MRQSQQARPHFPIDGRILAVVKHLANWREVCSGDGARSEGQHERQERRIRHHAQLAERTGLEITVAHYPPGTSK